MAGRTNQNGIFNGSAAYDLRQNYSGTAAPKVRPQGLPEEHYIPERHRRVKDKMAVAPFGLVGFAVALCMMVLVVFGYVQVHEAADRVNKLERELASLRENRAVLESLYEGSIDMTEVELAAAELGLSIPTREQTVYVNLAGGDCAEVYAPEHTNLVERILNAFQSSAGGLVEYLS